MTEEDIRKFTQIYKSKDYGWDEKLSVLSELIGKKGRTVRNWAKALGLIEKDEPIPEQYETAKQMTFDKDKEIFLITWAQNNTPVHKEFLNNLITYKDYLGGELHVIAGRYKNPTSVFSDEDESWVKEVLP